MPPCRGINFTHVKCKFRKCGAQAESSGHHHSCPYIDKEAMEITKEDNCEVIKMQNKEVSLGEVPLSPIPRKLFEKYKALSTNVNLMDGYHNL